MIVGHNLIKIENYTLGAGVDDRVRRDGMAFKFGEVPIRVIVANPINYAY
jgi:hypothetical protein